MGLHHWQEDVATVALRIVPADAPPAGLGYPDPTSYRPDPVTGMPTPPRAIRVPRPRSTRAPLAVAALGAAVALVGMGAHLPGLVAEVQASVTPTAATSPATPVATTPALTRQCATVAADALDDTVDELGRTPRIGWPGVVDRHEGALASTYGTDSPEYRAYVRGAEDVMDVLHRGTLGSTALDAGVTTRVAHEVAAVCATP